MTKLFETQWTEYRTKVIPNDASAVQLTESRRAFYAGAWAFYSLMMNNFDEGTDETPRDLELMRKLDTELREFKTRVSKGWA